MRLIAKLSDRFGRENLVFPSFANLASISRKQTSRKMVKAKSQNSTTGETGV